MKNLKTIEVSYSFDCIDILGVIGEDVFLIGTPDFEHDCVIQISRHLFKESLDYWLNDKKEYCEHWGHFCGVMGSIRSLDCEELGKKEVDGKLLKLYKVIAIDSDTDMEHG